MNNFSQQVSWTTTLDTQSECCQAYISDDLGEWVGLPAYFQSTAIGSNQISVPQLMIPDKYSADSDNSLVQYQHVSVGGTEWINFSEV